MSFNVSKQPPLRGGKESMKILKTALLILALTCVCFAKNKVAKNKLSDLDRLIIQAGQKSPALRDLIVNHGLNPDIRLGLCPKETDVFAGCYDTTTDIIWITPGEL